MWHARRIFLHQAQPRTVLHTVSMCIVGLLCVCICNVRTRALSLTQSMHGHVHMLFRKWLSCRTSPRAAVSQQSLLRLLRNLAAARATLADQEAAAAGRAALAWEHAQRLQHPDIQKRAQLVACSSCSKQVFVELLCALLPRGAAPMRHATPWTQSALLPKRAGCVASPRCRAQSAHARTHPLVCIHCADACRETNQYTHH